MWNYKSAVLSSCFRSSLFFTTNLSAGLDAATAALVTEFLFRFVTSGFYGAATQAFRRVDPPRLGTLGAVVLLPSVAHSLEFLVHSARGTPELAASMAASMAFTALSTAFNLFAMRRGVLIVGDGARSLGRDLASLPRLMVTFLGAAAR